MIKYRSRKPPPDVHSPPPNGLRSVEDDFKDLEDELGELMKKQISNKKGDDRRDKGGGIELLENLRHIKIDIDRMPNNVLKHVIGNMNNYEFNLLRGFASKVLKKSHPLDNYISGDFVLPASINPIVIKDILSADHPHQLSEALHAEDEKGGKLLGKGVKFLLKKGSENSNTSSKHSTSISNSVNHMVQKGIQVAELFEGGLKSKYPKLINNNMAKHLKNMTNDINKQSSITKGSLSMNAILHGASSNIVSNIFDQNPFVIFE